MSNRRIEMLALGIATLNNAFNPDSDAFQLFNWGLNRIYSFKHLGSADDAGRRSFTSVVGGFRFLVQDLTWKCSGDTRAKGNNGRLKSTSTLPDLLASFRLNKPEHIFELIDFLQRALKDADISAATELSYFLNEEPNAR